MFDEYHNALLNKDYYIQPFGSVHFEIPYFVRPNSGNKTFPAMVYENSKEFYKALSCYNISKNELCVIAPTNELIIEEIRFVVVDGQIITGSTYRDKAGFLDHDKCRVVIPSHWAWERAQRILDNSTALNALPHRIFIMDVARCAVNISLARNHYDNVKVVECNAFSTSGLYACDLDKIVAEVNRISEEEYKEYNE
jgi:hypothetical protein